MAAVSTKEKPELSRIIQPRRPIGFTKEELHESVNELGNQVVKMEHDITAVYSLGAQADIARRAIYQFHAKGAGNYERQLGCRVFGSQAGCGVIGGAIGAVGGPPGVLIGASIGLGLGTLVGAGAAGHLKLTHYEKWLKKFSIETEMQLMQVFSDMPALQAFLCPLSGSIIKNPVRTPSGQIFEFSDLEKSVKKFGTDPMTNEPIKQEELLEDYAYMGEFSVALRCLIELGRTNARSPALMQAFNALHQDLSERIEQSYQNAQNKLNQLVKEGKISPHIRKLALNEIDELLFVEIPQNFRDDPSAYFRQSKEQVLETITVIGYETAVRASLEPPKFVPGDRKEGDGVTDSGMGLGLPAPVSAGPGAAACAV